jgi:hypothetical protein
MLQKAAPRKRRARATQKGCSKLRSVFASGPSEGSIYLVYIPNAHTWLVGQRCLNTCRSKRGKKPNRGARPTPRGLRPQHPKRGGTRGGNSQQHVVQAAAGKQTESDARAQKQAYMSPKAPRHPQQKPQPRTKAARTEHTASRREQGQPCSNERDSGAKARNVRTESASEKST